MCLSVLGSNAFSQSAPQDIEIARLTSSPVIDGKADDKCWADKKWNSGFTVLGQSAKKAPIQTRYKVAHDQYFLYFIVECLEPKVTKMKPEYGNEWNGESVVLCVATSLHPDSYYAIKTNPSAKTYKYAYQGDGTGLDIFVQVPLWDIPIQSASTRQANSWIVEMAVPLAGFGISEKTLNEWRVNVTRRRFLTGRAEDSTYTPLQGKAIGRPEKLSKAVIKQFDASLFNFKLGEPEIRVTKKHGKLFCSVTPHVENLTKRSMLVSGQVALTSTERPTKSRRVHKRLPAHSSKEMNITLPLTAQGKHNLTLELSTSKGGNKPLAYLFREVTLDYTPIKLSLLAPAYRNSIYASQNLKDIVAEISVEDRFTSIPVVVELSGPEKYLVSKNIDLSKANTVRFDAAQLKNGKYLLTARFSAGPMKGVASQVRLRKLPRLKGEVWLDVDNVTYIDGKKFMPIGWFNAPLEARLTRKVMLSQRQFQSIEHAKQTLDQALADNIKLIILPDQEYDKKWRKVEFNVKTGKCQGRMTQKQKLLIKKFVNAVKDHPALLGWFLVDEPELYKTSPSWYEDLYELMQEIDPYHPCIITNCSERGIRAYRDSCDILLPDYYPNYLTGQPPLQPFARTATLVQLAGRYRATWLIAQAFCSVANSRPELNPRPPRFHELRSQIYQVFANNGKGILLWDFSALSQLYYPLRLGPAYLDAELTAIKDELLAPNIDNGVTISTNPELKHFQVALKKAGNDYCLIAVNTEHKPAKVRFSLKPKDITRIYVMGTSHAVDVSNSSFTDTLSAFETKVYLTSKEKANKTNLPEFLSKLDAAEKSRFKPGNIVAVGAKTMKELRDLQTPDINKAPIITASSINRNYFYYVWQGHPLYCVLDGITDLNYRWMGWHPNYSDPAPWLKVQFRKETINRVKLYTYREKDKAAVIEDCKVYVNKNGNMVLVGQVKGNTNEVLEFSFAPIETTEVKIIINKQKKGAITHYHKGYTLSEIEVYKANGS